MSQDDNYKQNANAGEYSPEVEQELSQVATNPKQSMLILIGISIAFLYLFFNLFISGDDSNPKDDTPIPTDVARPVQINVENDIPSIPTLPSPPKLEDPTPPKPTTETEALPTAAETLPALPTNVELPSAGAAANTPSLPFANTQSEESRKRMEAKRKSAIVLVAGTPAKKTAEQIQEEANFKYRGDMNLILGRGKMLDAIIETAINTDFGGEIRAVINRDIYSEWGKNILLPKGSRVFGNYTTGIDGAYGRISVEWTRIDLANGYTLNLSGSGMDALGRKGYQGRVDNKFKERFSNAVLRSAFNVMLAKGVDSAVTPQITSQAAANQNQISSNVKSIANKIFAQSNVPPKTRRLDICIETQKNIEDKTSTIYTTIVAACTALETNPSGASEEDKLNSLMSTINSAADSLLQNTTANVEETKAQAAAKQAFTDISDVAKTLVEEQEFKPTITIDQGTHVKIYVNKDYKFPKAAISNHRSMK